MASISDIETLNAETEMIRRFLTADTDVCTITNYSPDRRSMAAYVRVYVPIVQHDGRASIMDITYQVHRIINGNKQLSDKGIRTTGGGYNRALHVLDNAARVCGVPFRQGHWREL